MLNENVKYLKYKAYATLYKKAMQRFEELNVGRPAVSKLKVVLRATYDGIYDTMRRPQFDDADTMESVISKKLEINTQNAYRRYLKEAYEDYDDCLDYLDRPSIANISKKLHKVLDTVTTELLEV